MVVIRLLFPCYVSSGIQRWQRRQRSQRRPGNFLFQMAVNVHLRINVLLTGKNRRGMEERSLKASSRECRSGEGKQWSHLCEGFGAAPCPCAPGPVHRGLMSHRRNSLEVTPVSPRLCSPEPGQLPKTLSAVVTIIPGGGEIRGLRVLSAKEGKVNCFRCKWRNADFGSCPGSRVVCRQEHNWNDFARETEAVSRESDRGVMAPYKELYSLILFIKLHLLHYLQCWVSAGVFNWYPHMTLVFFLPRKVLLCQRSLHIFWSVFSFDFVGRNRLSWNAGTKSK